MVRRCDSGSSTMLVPRHEWLHTTDCVGAEEPPLLLPETPAATKREKIHGKSGPPETATTSSDYFGQKRRLWVSRRLLFRARRQISHSTQTMEIWVLLSTIFLSCLCSRCAKILIKFQFNSAAFSVHPIDVDAGRMTSVSDGCLNFTLQSHRSKFNLVPSRMGLTRLILVFESVTRKCERRGDASHRSVSGRRAPRESSVDAILPSGTPTKLHSK